MAIVDSHNHIYPDKIAQRAVASVADFYGIGNMHSFEGTAQALLDTAAGSPITHHLVCSVAVKPSTVTSINDFIAEECAKHPQFIGLAAMHQDFQTPVDEIDRIVGLGLKGIKVHPDTQQVNADDPRLMEIYELAQERKLPVLIHTGDYRYDYSHPRRIANICQTFPELVVCAAHFGGWSIFDIGADLLCYERCFVDTSSSFELTGTRHAAELIKIYGHERVMFGSDFPMWDPVKELDMLKSIGYSQEVFEDLTWHNFERFIGCKIGE